MLSFVCLWPHVRTHTHTHIYIYIYARVHVHTHTNADAAVATLHKLFSPAKNMFPHHHHPAPGKKISAYRDAVLSALCRRTDRRTDGCAVTRPGRVYADMRESSFVMAWLSVLHTDIHHRHHKMSPPFHVVEFCVAQHRILESTRPSFESLSVVQEERPHKSKSACAEIPNTFRIRCGNKRGCNFCTPLIS